MLVYQRETSRYMDPYFQSKLPEDCRSWGATRGAWDLADGAPVTPSGEPEADLWKSRECGNYFKWGK
jgi:hypothetical protein